ncbi:thiazole synthase [bacterium]|nr:thiazole synthase [bacterium]
MLKDTKLTIAGREFGSRLLVGTGKYKDNAVMVEALAASGAEVVTVAVRRVDLKRSTAEALLNFIDPKKYFLLPNTAGCYSVEEALRTARLGREALDSEWVKLEVIGDERTLLPDAAGLIEATKVLVKEGFKVLPYTNDDLIVARRLEEAGASAVMPLASPIGSGMGVLNPINIQFIREAVKVPVIVDAGVGSASDATRAMELGVDGILMNTAIALAADPVAMATAMRLGVEAGRLSFLAGRMPRKQYADPSSPTAGMIGK